MLKDIWEYNKKAILITLIIVLAILIVVYYLITTNRNKEIINNNEVETTEISKIVLFGAREITLTEGDKYIEPGYYALTTTNEIKQEEIEVTPEEIDTSVPGTYYISYTIGTKKETREIIVLEKEEKEEKSDKEETGVLTLTLEGESMMVINVGSKYTEPGYKAIDTIDGDITDKVEVSGVVNTGVAGSYSLTYEVTNSSLKKVTKTRTVIVKNAIINASITGNPTSYTNQNVTLKIEVSGENFNYVKYPDGTVLKNKSSSYAIEKNGTYTFLIYDKESNYISKQVKVDKIDKTGPTGTCVGTVTSGKTIFVATGKDDASGMNRYVYYGDGKELKSVTQLSYTHPKELKTAYVNLYDNASNVSKVTCKMVNNKNSSSSTTPTPSTPTEEVVKYDYLEIHFIVSGYYDDAILIRTGKGTILIDSGRYNAYKRVVPYLQDLGVKTIDAMIGSHTDGDHIQAQAEVIKNFTVKNAYYPVDLNTCVSKGYCDTKDDLLYILPTINQYKIPTSIKKAGETLTVGDMTLYFIGPYTYKNTGSHRGNFNSFIFILKYKNTTLMFPGDADSSTFNLSKVKPYADQLGISLKVDVLKYPHHGNASLETNLLNSMMPEYVVIPNYKASKYPNEANEKKLKQIGAKVYENASDGNIVLTSDGTNITFKTNQSAINYKR